MYTQHFGQIPRYFTTWRHFCGETHTNTTCSLILIYKQAMYKTSTWCLSTLLNGSNLQQNIIAWEVGLSLDSNITAVDTHSGKHLIKCLPLSVRAGLCAAWFSPGPPERAPCWLTEGLGNPQLNQSRPRRPQPFSHHHRRVRLCRHLQLGRYLFASTPVAVAATEMFMKALLLNSPTLLRGRFVLAVRG